MVTESSIAVVVLLLWTGKKVLFGKGIIQEKLYALFRSFRVTGIHRTVFFFTENPYFLTKFLEKNWNIPRLRMPLNIDPEQNIPLQPRQDVLQSSPLVLISLLESLLKFVYSYHAVFCLYTLCLNAM